MGQQLMGVIEEMKAVNNKTFSMKLTKPYGLVLESIGKISSNVPFMMPKRLAETDPFQQVPEIIGSGPFMFNKDEWVPGSLVVYSKFKDYKPRSEPTSGAAGAKIAKVDRVEWHYIPDATTAMNALISGEIDYYEQVPADLVPILKGNPEYRSLALSQIRSTLRCPQSGTSQQLSGSTHQHLSSGTDRRA